MHRSYTIFLCLSFAAAVCGMERGGMLRRMLREVRRATDEDRDAVQRHADSEYPTDRQYAVLLLAKRQAERELTAAKEALLETGALREALDTAVAAIVAYHDALAEEPAYAEARKALTELEEEGEALRGEMRGGRVSRENWRDFQGRLREHRERVRRAEDELAAVAAGLEGLDAARRRKQERCDAFLAQWKEREREDPTCQRLTARLEKVDERLAAVRREMERQEREREREEHREREHEEALEEAEEAGQTGADPF